MGCAPSTPAAAAAGPPPPGPPPAPPSRDASAMVSLLATTKGLSSPDARKRTGAEAEFRAWTSDWDGFVRREGAERVAAALWAGASLPSAEPASVVLLLLLLAQAELAAVFTLPTAAALLRGAAAMFAAPERHVEVRLAACDVLLAAVKAAPALARPFLLALPAAGGSPPPPVTPGLLASLCASPSSPLELRAACVALAASLCPADGGAGPATEAAVELFAREGLWAAAVALLAAVSSSPAPQPAAAASTHAAPTVALVVQRAVLSALARVCAVGGVASHDALASVPAAIGALTSALASALAQHDPPAPAAAGAGADAGQAPTPLHHHAGAGGHVTTFAAWDGAASVAAVSAALIDALCRRPAAAADRAAVVATGHTTRALLALLSVEWSQPAPGGGPGASDAAGLAHAVATSALEALLAAATASDSPRPSAAQPHHHHEAGGSLPAALGEPRPKAATPALSSRSSRRVVLPPLTAASAAAAPPSASAWAAVLGAAASDGLAALSFVTLLAQASARGGDTYHSLQRLVASHHAPFAAALAPPPPPPPPALLAPEDAGADDPTSALPPRRAAAPAPSSAPPALLTSVEARLVAILTSSAPHMQPARQRCAPLLWQLAVERARHTSARWARLRRLHRLQLAYQVAEAAGRLLAVKAATGVSFAVLEAYAANAASAVADAAAENGSGDIALSGPAAPALPTLPASLLAAAAASELYDWRATGEWVLSVDALGLPTFVHTPSGCAQYLEPSGPPPPQRPPPPPASSSSSSSSAAATAAASSRLEAPDFDSDAEEDHDDHDAGSSPPPHSRGWPAAAAAAAQPSPAAAATAAAHQYLEGLPREDALALACKIVLVAATAPPVLRSLLGLRLAAQPREDDREGLGVFLGLWRAGYFRHSPAVQAELDAASGIVRRPEESEVDGVAADAAAWWRDDPVVRLCAAGIAAEALTGNAEGRADYRHPLLPPPRSGGGGGGGGGGLAVASDDDLAAGDGEGVEEGETGEGDLIAGEEAEGEQQQPGGGGGGDEGALLRDAEAAVPTALAAGVRELQAGAGPGAIVGTTTRAAPRGRHWPAIALDWDAPWVRDALACIRDVVESLDAARTAAAAASAEAAAAHSSASSASSSSISWPPRGARARAAPSPPPASAAAGAPPPQFQWGPDHLASIARLARSGYAEIAAFAAFAVREAVVPPASVTATTGAGAWAAAAAPAVAPSVTPLALALSPAAAAPEGGDAAAGPVTVAVTYACLAAPLPLPTPAGAAAAAAAAQPAGSGLSCDEARAVLVACGALAGLRAAHGRLSAALPDAYRAAGSTGGGGAAGTATAAGASAASPRRFGASLRALSFGLPSLRRAAGGGAGNGGWMAAYRGGGPPPGGASTAAGAPALLSPSRRQAALLATGGAVHAHVAGAGQDWALGHQLINDALIALAEAGSAAAAAPLAAAVTTTSVVSPLALAAAAAAPSSSSSPTAGHRHHARVTFAAPRPEPADDDATEAPAAVGAPSSSSSSSAPPPGTPTAPAHEAAPAPHDAAEPLSPLEANDALTDFYALKNRILEARSRRSILADKYGDSGSPAAAADGDGSDSAPPA